MKRAFVVTGMALAVAVSSATAQPASSTDPHRGEAEFLVAPQGGAFEVPIHAGTVVILSFPEKMAKHAVSSSSEYDVKAWGDDGVAVLALAKTAKPATLALATASGAIKVNVTLRVVAESQEALTMVRFKAATTEEVLEATVRAEVARRTARLERELAVVKQALDDKVRNRADALMARRLLSRHEMTALKAKDRNDDHVIVEIHHAILVGEDAYLLFEIQNRSGGAYRLAQVKVLGPNGKNHAGPASLTSSTVEDVDQGLVGIIPAGGRGRGIVVLREVDLVIDKSLTVIFEEPGRRGRITIGRGVVLR